ncbi:MAG: sulfurtransferase-like selenium metabolism protein YedF [Bacteroidales bacterium]|nr:sulfurtransferase-like selenium metabolism protein YedF [Bacteroidales bacterium]
MKIIDVKGKQCPMPLIETKKALKEADANESFKVLINNPTSAKNVTHFLKDNAIPFTEKTERDEIEIIVNNTGQNLEEVDETAYCSTCNTEPENFVVLMAKDRLGEGSDELGEALAGAMINTLKAIEPLPTKIIFMNSGINLVVKGSLVLDNLKYLQDKGVDLIVCGTCLDYFGKMDDLIVGRVSNMLDIVQSMKDAQKVLNF